MKIKTISFGVIIHSAEEGGFWAEVPSLPGCVSQGETIDETLKNVKEAIKLFLETMIEDGEPIPECSEQVREIIVSLPIPT